MYTLKGLLISHRYCATLREELQDSAHAELSCMELPWQKWPCSHVARRIFAVSRMHECGEEINASPPVERNAAIVYLLRTVQDILFILRIAILCFLMTYN